MNSKERATLIEHGFGILKFYPDYDSLVVTISEPLMLETILAHFGANNGVNKFLSNIALQRISTNRQPSSRGFLWEEFVPHALVKLFSEKVISMELFGGNSNDTANIWYPDSSMLHVELFTKHTTQSLAQFLNSPETPFYLPGNVVGPDIVLFFLVNGKRIPVFIQLKFSANVNRKQALGTTNPINFYSEMKKGKRKTRLGHQRDLDDCLDVLKNGTHIGILIAYPMSWKSPVSSTSDHKLGYRIEKIFDLSNASELFTDDHLTFLQQMWNVYKNNDSIK